jgi:hypothetical protein
LHAFDHKTTLTLTEAIDALTLTVGEMWLSARLDDEQKAQTVRELAVEAHEEDRAKTHTRASGMRMWANVAELDRRGDSFRLDRDTTMNLINFAPSHRLVAKEERDGEYSFVHWLSHEDGAIVERHTENFGRLRKSVRVEKPPTDTS